jgi:hypothetical protein
MDFVLPSLKASPLNVYVEKDIYDIIEQEKRKNLLGERVQNFFQYIEDLKYPPLKGNPPYENFQSEAAWHFVSKKHYGLFLKQGMGKSWVITISLEYLLNNNKIDKALILTPGSGLINLKRSFLKFTHIDPSFLNVVTKDNRNMFDPPYSDRKSVV